MAVRDRLLGLGPQRVDEADETEEGQFFYLSFQVLPIV